MTGDRERAVPGTGEYGEGWRLRSCPLWVRLGVTAAGVALVAAALLLRPVNPGLALLAAALGVSLVLLTWLEPNPHRTPPRTVERDGAVGLLVPLRTLPTVAMVALGAVAAAFVAYGVVLAAGALRDGDLWRVLLSLAPLALGVVVAAVPLTAVRNRSRVPHPGLLLTPDGLHLPGPGLPVVRWEEVATTGASWVARPARSGASGSPASNLLNLRLTPAAADLRVEDPHVADTGAFHLSVEALACDPYAVKALLDHYLAVPHDRAELGTDAALSRFEQFRAPAADR